MKNKLFTLAAALTLAAVLGSIYAAPALAQVIKAALVKNVDEPGRAPLEIELKCDSSGSTCTNASFINLFKIPVGQRFVVEHISGGVSRQGGGAVVQFFVINTDSSFPVGNFAPELVGSDGERTFFAVNEPYRTYFEPGNTPKLFVGFASAPITATVKVRLTGYLVDLSL